MRRSRSRPVFLAIDNTQFLPFAVCERLTAELAEAARTSARAHRTRSGRSRVELGTGDRRRRDDGRRPRQCFLEEVRGLVRRCSLGEDIEEIAATIFRRSDGNLKSVWFQLRLIASRRADQETLPTSYEDVILTLPPLDQAVLRFIVFTVGGLTIANLISLLHATDLHLGPMPHQRDRGPLRCSASWSSTAKPPTAYASSTSWWPRWSATSPRRRRSSSSATKPSLL